MNLYYKTRSICKMISSCKGRTEIVTFLQLNIHSLRLRSPAGPSEEADQISTFKVKLKKQLNCWQPTVNILLEHDSASRSVVSGVLWGFLTFSYAASPPEDP